MGNMWRLFVAFFALWLVTHSRSIMGEAREGAKTIGSTLQGHRSRREVNWNSATDVIINHAKHEILKQEKGRVDLRAINETFNKKFKFLVVKGFFRASEGWLEDFSSLHRIGDVTFTKEGSAVLLTAVMGLGDLRLGYDYYEAELWRRRVNGTLRGTIGRNEIHFVVKFDVVNGESKTSLIDIRVLKFEEFQLSITGVGPLDFIVEKVLQWLLEKKRENIKGSVARQLRDEIDEALEDFNCDEYASLLSLPF